MSGYIPDPNDATQPTDGVIAETAAPEFRALKAKVNNISSGAIQGSGLQNILLNGDFAINQLNGLNVVNLPVAAGQLYITDMWNIGSNGITASALRAATIDQSVAGFAQPPNYGTYHTFAITTPVGSIAAGTFFEFCQYIEGTNMRHMGFGTPNARASTILFYCRSSIAGLVLSGTLRNGAANRSYVFNFTTGAANVWTRYAIPVTGDVVGGQTSWPTSINEGAQITFTFGCGSTFKTATPRAWLAGNFIGTSAPDNANFLSNVANSTLEFTGVEWRPGTYTIANPVEIIPFPIAVMMCARYYFKDSIFLPGAGALAFESFPAYMRKAPIYRPTPAGSSLLGVSNTTACIQNPGANVAVTAEFDARLEVT